MTTHSRAEIEAQVKAAWMGGVALLSRAYPEAKARTMFGRLIKQYGLSAHELLPAIRAADRAGTLDPYSYLVKAAQGVQDGHTDPALKASWT